MGFNPADYEDVDSRVHRFWERFPEGSIQTEILRFATTKGDRWTVRAEVYRNQEDARPAGIGHADEIDGEGNVNRTSALENCETSAVGRALADAGFSPKGQRPSRQEMEKANRSGTGQRASSPTPQAGRQAPSQPSKAKRSGSDPAGPQAASPPSRDGDRPIPATAASSHSSSEGVARDAGEVAAGAPSEGSTYELIARAMSDTKMARRVISSANVAALKADHPLPEGGVSKENIMELPDPVLEAVVEKLELGATA